MHVIVICVNTVKIPDNCFMTDVILYWMKYLGPKYVRKGVMGSLCSRIP